MIVCSMPGCQTTAGCQCKLVTWHPAPHAAPAAVPTLVWSGTVSIERRAHKVMTPEEYAAMPIIGWHEVCKNVDGFGGIGVRFLT